MSEKPKLSPEEVKRLRREKIMKRLKAEENK